MAVTIQDSCVSAGKKLKSLKKKKMKMVARATSSKLEDEDKDAADGRCSVRSCGIEEDDFSSDDEATETDKEEDVEPCDQENENTAESNVGTNTGWADAMAKLLNNKAPENKPTILIKNKELEKEKEKLKQERLKKTAWKMMCRVKPDIVKDKETETNLQRIAMRGVVQLFNAVQKHQKNFEEKVKEERGSTRKCARLVSTVNKNFISVLRGMDGKTNEKSSTGMNSKAKKIEVKSEEPGWNILCDNFIMGASMKDWDKGSDRSDNSRSGSQSESDT
uniref:RRP15-like protein n=1 Tax=Loxodonta africana TaxID=9785 RepID=G3TSU9_LOXAF